MRSVVWGWALWLCAACGPTLEEQQVKPPPEEEAEEADNPNADVPRARQYIKQALKALEAGDTPKARKLLVEAEPFADVKVNEEIRDARQRIDSSEADEVVPHIVQLAKAGSCEEAMSRAATISETRRNTAVPTFIKQRSSQFVLDCLLKQLEIDVSIGRELAQNEAIKAALEKKDYQALLDKVNSATVSGIMKRLEEPIAKRDWADVMRQIEELVKSGEAGKDDHKQIITLVREGVGEDAEAKIAEALGQSSGAAQALKEVDAILALGRWGTGKNDSIEERPLPDKIVQRRSELALWAVCGNLGCKLSAPVKMWSYGRISVRPPLDTKGEAVATVEHATVVWRIADSSSMALISKKDPGKPEGLAARLPIALGWVRTGDVREQDTAEWLPPGEAIVGTRVWGPLRDGQKDLEIGTVTGVAGNDVEVRRFSDRQTVKVARSKVQFGTVTPGTKVLALCQNPLKATPAVIDKVTFPRGSIDADPEAQITCLDDSGQPSNLKPKTQIGSLRTQSGWLPARK